MVMCIYFAFVTVSLKNSNIKFKQIKKQLCWGHCLQSKPDFYFDKLDVHYIYWQDVEKEDIVEHIYRVFGFREEYKVVRGAHWLQWVHIPLAQQDQWFAGQGRWWLVWCTSSWGGPGCFADQSWGSDGVLDQCHLALSSSQGCQYFSAPWSGLYCNVHWYETKSLTKAIIMKRHYYHKYLYICRSSSWYTNQATGIWVHREDRSQRDHFHCQATCS